MKEDSEDQEVELSGRDKVVLEELKRKPGAVWVAVLMCREEP